MNAAPVFLDRDGTLIVEKHYLSDPDLVELEQHAAEGLRLLQELGLPLVVVTNQSGVGRGMFSRAQAEAVNERVDALLRREGVRIHGWYMCPHAPATPCECRKPLPGMVRQAQSELGLGLEGAVVVGDKKADVLLADAIGGTGLLVTTGHGRDDEGWARKEGRPVLSDLRDAARWITARRQR